MSLVIGGQPSGGCASPVEPGPPPYAQPGMSHGASGPAATRASEPLVVGLRQHGAARDAALAELHALLLRGAHHELRRRRDLFVQIPRAELDDLATQAADDALAAILA